MLQEFEQKFFSHVSARIRFFWFVSNQGKPEAEFLLRNKTDLLMPLAFGFLDFSIRLRQM